MQLNESSVPLLIAAVLGLLFLFLGMRTARRRRLVDNLPTCKTTGVFVGFVELVGTAEAQNPLTSFLAEAHCVYYSYDVSEHWSRTVTETYTDSKGKTRTRTRHESGWKTVDSGAQGIPFYLKDDHGYVLVRPEHADLQPRTIFSETCGRSDPLYYQKGPPGSVMHSDHRRRFTETAIPLHAGIYVLGQAREREDVVAPEIAYDKNAPMFLISTREERTISRNLRAATWAWWIAGVLVFAAGAWFSAQGFRAGQALPLALCLSVAAYLAFFAVGWTWMVYNSMVDLRQRVNQAWSLVDVQLKRRHDLIPNLVSVVTGLRDHEHSLQEELALMRSQLSATPPGVNGPDYAALTRTVIALKEAYPQLTADAAFERLQKTLSDTETRIALARGYFNEIATAYNTRLESIPDGWVARLAQMQPRNLMAANDFERAPVPVDFAT